MGQGVDVINYVILADSGGTDITNPAIWGPGAALVAGFIAKIVVPGWLYTKSEKENDRLRLLIEDRVIPALEKSNDVLAAALNVISQVETELDTVRKTPVSTRPPVRRRT
jgi:hypothetical protein